MAKAKKTRPLTIKQQRFIDVFAGDIKEAAKKAGINYDYARRLATKSHIKNAIKNRVEKKIRPRDIASRKDRQQFWTEVMRGGKKKSNMRDRLRASELLGKSEADFTENINHGGSVRIVLESDKE